MNDQKRTAVSTVVAAEGVPYQQMERMANAVAKSGLFGVKTAEQALALMMIAQAEGTHPATAARDYHIIQGRPALKADTMLARFQAAGGKVQWDKYTDAEVAGTFSHPNGGTLSVGWTIERAKSIGLASKDTWKHYPRAMLRSRVISEAVRTLYPGIAQGIYTVEEVQDMVDVTPPRAEFQQENAAALEAAKTTGVTLDEQREHIAAMNDCVTLPTLKAAFETAWKHAKLAGDEPVSAKFKGVYDHKKADIETGSAI